MSGSLGRLDEIDYPDVRAAIAHVTDVCTAGILLGIFGLSAEPVTPYLAKGYTLNMAGVDTLLLAQAANTLLNQLKS